jgi:threonine/homoserine/homoserine lactone efflux protein
MTGTHDLWLFVLSGLLLNITPGPDTLYIVGRSSAQGGRAGAIAALGIGAGTLVHICAAALGLSALLATSATLFTAVKFVGAAYLLYVGITLMRESRAGATSASAGKELKPHAPPSECADAQAAPTATTVIPRIATLRSVFIQGFLTNVLNPKVALFFLAFLPQFVQSDASSKPLAFLFLGAIFDVNGTLWNLLVAWSTARLSRGLSPNAAFKRWFNRCVGAIFIFIGIRLALAQEHI